MDASRPSMPLSSEERERFALWLEADARAEDILLAQMHKVGLTALAIPRRRDIEAKRRVAAILRGTDTVDV